ncbi:MAG: flagellar M-ring protein FliF [Clostridiaceae bacterium]|nr:flagellar M-ring protein FliF [Clostridiaceae bacterium]
MSESLEQIRNQLNDYLQGLEKKQKIKMVVAALFLLLFLTGLIYYFTRPQYVVLYNNLEHRQAGEVMNVLQSSNIKADYGDNSSTILVQKQDYQKAQVLVATEGLPQARFSYEDFFSGNNFMKTSEEKSKEFIVALGNELGKIIEEISGVQRAYVTLSVPETTGFIRAGSGQEQQSKASVFLNLDYNAMLDNNSINGIGFLVANAVQGLEPENVTIHGPDGRVLNQQSQSQDHTNAYGPNEQLTLQKIVKDDLEKSITDFLSSVYGYGNVVVMANVRLGFDSEITEIKEFSPPIEGETEGIIRSMQELQQRVASAGEGGAPGTDTNTGEIPQYVEGDLNDAIYFEANKTINYEINELRRKIVRAQGQVQDITVAVYLNSRAIEGGNLNDEDKRELQNIISAAAGLDTRIVEVGVQEFSSSFQDQFPPAMDIDGMGTYTKLPTWALGLIASLMLAAMYFVFTRIRKKAPNEIPIEEPIETQEEVEDIDLQLSGSQVKQQLERLVDKKPDAMAQLLKNWLSED